MKKSKKYLSNKQIIIPSFEAVALALDFGGKTDEMFLTSTPKGVSGTFYNMCNDAPLVSGKELAQLREDMLFEQEYGGSFFPKFKHNRFLAWLFPRQWGNKQVG